MNEYIGTYRGKVVSNIDPQNKGRIKIYVPGIFPETLSKDPNNLPWAEPVMPLFGGNYSSSNTYNKETGVCTIPHVNTEVWVFFENGIHLYPKYFGACQGGNGWFSEHSNQHVIKTDNVTVVVDEDPTSEASTCKFDTNNSQCTYISKELQKLKQPTRVNINIVNKDSIALNLYIKGNVNIKVDGDVFEEITGDKHETLNGNLYRQHKGDIHIVHEGETLIETKGSIVDCCDGNKDYTVNGYVTELLNNNKNTVINGNNALIVNGINTSSTYGAKSDIVVGQTSINISGNVNETITGYKHTIADEIISASKMNNITLSTTGNIYRHSTLGMIDDKAVSLFRKGVTLIQDQVNATGTIDHTNLIPIIPSVPDYPIT